MDNNLDLITYLFISEKQIIIYVNSEANKKIYKKKLILENPSTEIDFDKLDYFLNDNIFKIEKISKAFVKKVFLILDSKNFFSMNISIKKNNYENTLNFKILNHLLYDLKDSCKETIEGKKIIHMIIENYLIDKKDYNFFPNNIKCNSFSLDVNFICLSNDLIKNIEKILKKYQISLQQIVNFNYLSRFLKKEDQDIFLMCKRVINGHNPNEVFLVDKISKKQGFFEKFFSLFS